MQTNRFRGCLAGLACGDATGTTVEFKRRGSFTPVTDMVGGGPFALEKGQWTDDTSMALCLAASLLEQHGFDAKDQMDRYCRWHQQGYMSSNGRCFDIGTTVSQALRVYQASGEPFCGSTDPYSAGNGSLMRLAPVPMYYANDPDKAILYAAQSSKTTHGATECIEACMLFAHMLIGALQGKSREAILFEPNNLTLSLTLSTPKVRAIATGDYQNHRYEALTGSGYVIESLESALWCFLHSNSFEQAILLAVNIGNDADTTAAICGQIAGAFYGYQAIPESWRDALTMREQILAMSDQLARIADEH